MGTHPHEAKEDPDLSVQTLVRSLVIVLRHGDGEPVFHFLQCEAGGFVAVVSPTLAYVGERCPG